MKRNPDKSIDDLLVSFPHLRKSLQEPAFLTKKRELLEQTRLSALEFSIPGVQQYAAVGVPQATGVMKDPSLQLKEL